MFLTKLPPELEGADHDSRTRLAVAAASILVHQSHPDLLLEIVERGPHDFKRFASSDAGYASQDFRPEDYDLIFKILVSHVQQHLVEPGVG